MTFSAVSDGMPTASIGATASFTNAPNIYAQKGTGAQVGGSAGFIGGGGFDYLILKDAENETAYHGGAITVGFYGTPTVAELHGQVTNTYVWGCNITDLFDKIMNLFG